MLGCETGFLCSAVELRDELMVLGCVSCRVVVDVGGGDVVAVVFWSDDVIFRVNEGVHLDANPADVEAVDVENLELGHEGVCVCSRVPVCNQSDDLLVGSDEWLDVRFVALVCSPDGDVSDKVWVDVGVVELFHDVGWEELIGVFEAVDGWL